MGANQSSSAVNEKPSAVVIGGGIVGVSAAWHLQKRGYSVTLIDKRAPGEETSWGNAGIIQRECVEPHAFPSGLKTLVRLALNMQTGARYDLYTLPQYAYPLFLFWLNSWQYYFADNAKAFRSLIVHCTEEHDTMITAARANHLVRRAGFYELFTQEVAEEARHMAQRLSALGVNLTHSDVSELQRKEPSMNLSRYVSSIFLKDDWTVTSPGDLVKLYADNFVAMGGRVIQDEVISISQIQKDSSSGAEEKKMTPRWSVSTRSGVRISTPSVVVALGPWSASFMKPLGYHFPMLPLRGYNTHFSLQEGSTLGTNIIDVKHGFALGPMKQGVRMTTGVEMAGLSAAPTDVQVKACAEVAHGILPIKEQTTGVWHGYRPFMPDMKPVIGESARDPGLWFCFGHGAQGFTLGPVSGRLLAEMLTGDKTIVDPKPFAPDRF